MLAWQALHWLSYVPSSKYRFLKEKLFQFSGPKMMWLESKNFSGCYYFWSLWFLACSSPINLFWLTSEVQASSCCLFLCSRITSVVHFYFLGLNPVLLLSEPFLGTGELQVDLNSKLSLLLSSEEILCALGKWHRGLVPVLSLGSCDAWLWAGLPAWGRLFLELISGPGK